MNSVGKRWGSHRDLEQRLAVESFTLGSLFISSIAFAHQGASFSMITAVSFTVLYACCVMETIETLRSKNVKADEEA